MRETLGWICLGIGAVCSVMAFLMEARGVSHSDVFGDDSFVEKENKIFKKISQKRRFKPIVFVGLLFFGLGMYLVGMFGK